MTDLQAMDFESAARAVIKFLHQRLGFDLWMVTRTDGADWIVLQSEDNGYHVQPGMVFPWADSFCARMTNGEGPRIAPESAAVKSYAEAPIGRKLRIGAYVGVPLINGDGSLFGTLCAIDPQPKHASIEQELPLIELLASILSGLLDSELKAIEAQRRAEHASGEAETDALTGLYNRRGWNRVMTTEDARCRRYGHQACLLAVDLDGLKRVNDTLGHLEGDALLRRAADALRAATRDSDSVARVGGDEFAVLAVQCGPEAAQLMLGRIRRAFAAAGVSASVGMGLRLPANGDLEATWREADQLMYLDKATRRGRLLETPISIAS